MNDCKNCQRVTPSELCSHCCVSDTNRERNTPTMWIGDPKTNADRIRAMSDEELAEFMAERYSNEAFMRLIDEGCAITESARRTLKRGLYIVWFDWLKQEPDNPELGGDT